MNQLANFGTGLTFKRLGGHFVGSLHCQITDNGFDAWNTCRIQAQFIDAQANQNRRRFRIARQLAANSVHFPA